MKLIVIFNENWLPLCAALATSGIRMGVSWRAGHSLTNLAKRGVACKYRQLRPGLIWKRGAICPMSSATPQSNLEAGRHMPNIFLRPQSNLEAGRHMPNIFPYAPVQSERAIRYIQISCILGHIHHTMITDSTTLSSKLVCF